MCANHFYLEELCLVHFMDVATRFSTTSIVSDKSMSTAIIAFEKTCVTHYWHPNKIRCDKAFSEGDFKSYIDERDIRFERVPAGRHSRNTIEAKHVVVRHIFIRLTQDENNSWGTAAIKSVAISKEFYGNSIKSFYEMPKGFSKPIEGMINQVLDEIVKAHQEL